MHDKSCWLRLHWQLELLVTVRHLMAGQRQAAGSARMWHLAELWMPAQHGCLHPHVQALFLLHAKGVRCKSHVPFADL